MGYPTLTELLEDGAAAAGADAPLLIPADGGAPLTFGAAAEAAGRMAGALRAAGVRPGDRVAVQVHKSPAALLLYLACLRAGAVFLPLNPAYTPDEVAHVLADAEPALVVADPAVVPESGPTLTLDATGGGTLAAAAAAAESAPPVPTRPDEVAVLLYTSGTTGRPKGAPLTQANLGANAATLRAAWGFGPGDRLCHILPIYHAHGLLVAANVSMVNGTPMVWHDRFDPAAVVAGMKERAWTVFMGVPTHYTRLLGEPGLTPAASAGVRLWVSGSAPLLASTLAEWEARTGARILERYGMTETVMLTSNPLDGERRPASVGPPLPGVEVRVTERGEPIAPGDVGEVEVRGPSVFGGYWRRPDLAAETFAEGGWFRTGDLGRLDSDGYLHLVGRSKDLVISGGLNVYPKEVETVLDAMAGVAESAVIGLPDPDLGEAVTAVIVPADGAAPDPEAVRREARRHLAGYKVPRRIEVVAALPRNAMGKVEKAALRRDLGAQPAPGAPAAAPAPAIPAPEIPAPEIPAPSIPAPEIPAPSIPAPPVPPAPGPAVAARPLAVTAVPEPPVAGPPTPDPVMPAYGEACIDSVVPALLAPPGTRPGWLPDPARHASQVVLLVLDGLGWEQLAARRGLAPALARLEGGPITSVAPTTTATALTSIVTGTAPAVHGIAGYRVRVHGPEGGAEVLNVLRWRTPSGDARPFVDPATFSRVPAFGGRPVPVVSRREFVGTGFTAAHQRGARDVGYAVPSAIEVEVRRLLAEGEPLVYAYYDGVDKVAHLSGFGEYYDAELRAADRLVADLQAGLPPGVALVVTADHGQVEVGEHTAVLRPEVLAGTTLVSGEARFRWLHARAGAASDVLAAARETYGHDSWVLGVEEAAAGGWFGGPLDTEVRARVGDVAIVPFAPVGYLDPDDPGEVRLVCRHGSLTAAEALVPLVAGTAR